MTDNEIIKALECCKRSADCKKCPLNEYSLMAVECMGKLIAESKDLIHRQKAEIALKTEYIQEQRDVIAELKDKIESFADRIVEQLEREFELIVDYYPLRGRYIKKSRAIAIVKGAQNE